MSHLPGQDPEGAKKSTQSPEPAIVVSEQKITQAVKETLKVTLNKISAEAMAEGKKALEIEEKSLNDAQRDKLKLENENLRQNLELRKTFADRAYRIVIYWFAFLTGIVLLSGLTWPSLIECFGRKFNVPTFELSDTVLVALLTTTTINVLGILLAVTLNLFPPKR